MGMQDSLVEQIQPAVLIRLTAHAQRAGKTVNDLLKDMLDERPVRGSPASDRRNLR
jgi:hypothetical protein